MTKIPCLRDNAAAEFWAGPTRCPRVWRPYYCVRDLDVLVEPRMKILLLLSCLFCLFPGRYVNLVTWIIALMFMTSRGDRKLMQHTHMDSRKTWGTVVRNVKTCYRRLVGVCKWGWILVALYRLGEMAYCSPQCLTFCLGIHFIYVFWVRGGREWLHSIFKHISFVEIRIPISCSCPRERLYVY